MNLSAAHEGWIGLNDHSKWAVSLPLLGTQHSNTANDHCALATHLVPVAAQNVSCFGDMNREAAQVPCISP